MSTKYIASNWRLPNQAGVDSYLNDNYGLSFSGNEYIDAGNSLDIVTSNHSFSIWLKTTTVSNQVVTEKGTNDELALQFGGGADAGKIFWLSPSTKIDETINDGTWHNIICVADGSVSRMYLDGVLKTIGGNKIQGSANSSNLNIGSRAGSFAFSGSISELTFFDYALSDGGVSVGETAGGQISTLYGSSSLGSASPIALKPAPVAYYNLGDNTSGGLLPNPLPPPTNISILTQPNEAVEDASVFDFDGSDDIIEAPRLNLTSAICVSFWIKTTATGVQWIVNEDRTSGTNRNWAILLASNKLNFLVYHTDGTNTQFIRSTASEVQDGEWHNVIFTWDGTTTTNAFKTFIDGANEESTTATSSGIRNLSSFGLAIGSVQQNAGFRFDGELSNVAIWNSDQSSEISNIYNSGVPATSYTNTPTAWYKLDQSANWDVSGSGYWDIPDASGNGNDGISSGMTSANLVLSDLSRNLPYDSYSFNFDAASSDYIDLGSADYTEGITKMSISGWFNPHISGVGGAAGIIAKESRDFYVGWYSSPANSIRFLISDDDGVTKDALNSLSLGSNADVLNKWHHFVCTWDASDKLKIYINGSFSTETNSVYATSALPTSTNTLEIGRRVSTYFDGQISNVSIFDDVLTSTQVMKLYANGTPQDLSTFTPAPPIAWWTLGSNSFFNGSNFICKDLIGSNDGTSVNAGVDALVGDTPRSEANGVGTNQSIPENLVGTTKYSSNNSWSINMSNTARVQDTP